MHRLFHPTPESQDEDEPDDDDTRRLRRVQANQIPSTSDDIERVFGVLDHTLASVPNLKLTTASGMTTYRLDCRPVPYPTCAKPLCVSVAGTIGQGSGFGTKIPNCRTSSSPWVGACTHPRLQSARTTTRGLRR